MKKVFVVLFSLLLSFGFSQNNSKDSTEVAQEGKETETKERYYKVEKKDGLYYYGQILEDDGVQILLLTVNIGKLYLQKSELKSIEPVDKSQIEKVRPEDQEINYGKLRREGAFTTRYYFTNNAFPIDSNENYAMLHIYGPEVHFAINDKFSLGIMSSWIGAPMLVAGKVNLYSKGLNHISLGNIVGSSSFLFNGRYVGGLHWLTYTRGTRELNVSASAGLLYHNIDAKTRNDYKFSYSDGFDYYYPSSNYEVSSEAASALNQSGYSQWEVIGRSQTLRTTLALSLAGIAPVGDKASFIFDCMGFIYRPLEVTYSDLEVGIEYHNFSNELVQEVVTIGQAELTKSNKLGATIVFMPAMRVNTESEHAFQVALGGVVDINENETTSFPLPMLSWLRMF